MTSKSEFQVMWIQAMKDGSFLTPKHNPSSVETTFDTYRSVLSVDMANDLEVFVRGGRFDLTVHHSTDHPSSPLYVEIVPTDSNYSVPGSGIRSYTPTPTIPCDRLVVVSGARQGWHIYAELRSEIERKVAVGKLVPPRIP